MPHTVHSARETRIGLALGSGGARGFAHIGVLRVLERSAIRPTVVCGTSSGAIIGLAYAAGMTVDEMADVCQTLRWRHLLRPSVRRDLVFDTERLEQFLAMIIDARDFADLDYACAAVAYDRATKERVLLTRGDPVRAACASSAIPRVFPPIEIDGRQLVDGAAVDAIPVGAARQLGADYVIGVAVLDRARPRFRPPRVPRAESHRKGPLPLGAASTPDRLVRPELDAFSPWTFRHAAELVRVGEIAAERALPAIAADLERRRCDPNVRRRSDKERGHSPQSSAAGQPSVLSVSRVRPNWDTSSATTVTR